MKRVESHIFQGMQRDVSISKQQPQFLWDAENIRLTAREGDTLMSVTNEKGSVESKNIDDTNVSLTGDYVGHCVLGNYLTVFTTDINSGHDYIYRINKGSDGTFSTTRLYGNSNQPSLGFSSGHPLQTLGIYENEFIQKVYWTDGINQPRVINICKDNISPGASSNYNENSFDFVPEMTLNDSLEIQKLSDNSGSFPAGVVQYAVSYYNKYGQQSNISCVSPLLSTSFAGRAGSPEEKISNSFRITIDNPDRSFEYLRLYSIFRSSLNGIPICRRVEDVRLGDGGISGSEYNVVTSGDIVDNQFVYMTTRSAVTSSDWSNASKPISGNAYGNVTPSSQNNIPCVNDGYSYYHFDKNTYPYLVIKFYNALTRYWNWVTWGDATDIYITTTPAVGTYSGQGNGYYIVGTDNAKKASNLIASTKEIIYQKSAAFSSAVVITDNGIIGDVIDPQELFYIGGEDITAETIESKDGTLFFGNIKLNQVQISDYKKEIQSTYSENGNIITGTKIESDVRLLNRPFALNGTNYKWGSSLNSVISRNTGTSQNPVYTSTNQATNPAGFKVGEHYRLGVQFQYKNGKWSEPVYIPHMSGTDDLGSFIMTTNPNLTDGGNTETYHTPRFKGTLGKTTCQKLYNSGYKRVRGVVVFPTAQDRLILAQGILNPTVASVTAHAQHSPDYQSSWFFRPWIANIENINNDNTPLSGAVIECRNNFKLFGFNDRGSEIQGLPAEYNNWEMDGNTIIFNNFSNVNIGDKDDQSFVTVTSELADSVFYVSQDYVTMHSPEFEFDDSLKNLDFIGTKLKKRGFIQFEANVGDIFIETSTPPIGKSSTGFVHKIMRWDASNGGTPTKRLCAGMFYNDWLVDENVGDKNTYAEYPKQGYEFGFMVYPWQRTGSLNNDCNRPAEAGTRSAVLKRKIISNMLYSRQSYFRTYSSENITLSSTPKIFDVDQIGLVKIGGDLNYYGNIDTLLGAMAPFGTIVSIGENKCSVDESNFNEIRDYAIRPSDNPNIPGLTDTYMSHSHEIFTAVRSHFWKGVKGGFERIDRTAGEKAILSNMAVRPTGLEKKSVGKENELLSIAKTGVRMKYKSTPHAVFSIQWPPIPTQPVPTDPLDNNNPVYNSLHFVELCRNANTTDFGGTTEGAIQGNTWVPAGEPVSLNQSGDTTFYYDWGDTWYERYDCLKTYPFTPEDENQIVEIGSFMVETHVNIDGRYDRNRGQDSNLYVNPQNFNLINPVYSQLDNFFSYKILDADFYKLDKFPATVAWTLQKNNASEVDAWTNVTMGSTLDMDGNAGKVTSINTSMDTLYCFQERGVSHIMFNSRVQINPTDGIPIEIGNNYKVDGSHYISNTIGCPNKFAIAKSPMGLYFVDGVGSTLYLLQGNQMQNISDTHGMGYWFSQQDTQNSWVPNIGTTNYAQGMKLCYDNVNGDLYILPNGGQALCYSDQLQQFVSFYDYYAYSIFNIGNSVHALTLGSGNSGVSMWNLFEGNYNQLLGTYYPSSITFVSNADMQMDKIFTNLETRADFYKNGELQHMHFFDTIRAWNEYQDTDWNDGTAHTTVLQHKYFPYSSASIASNTKKKFRIWRVDIPRAKKWVTYTEEEQQAMISSGSYTSETVPNGHFINVNDRIRNTWCKIKLSMNVPPSDLTGFETSKMEMHDMSVIYYI